LNLQKHLAPEQIVTIKLRNNCLRRAWINQETII